MLNLEELEEFTQGFAPDPLQKVQYLFFERGISLSEFNELPIPYIMDMIRTHIFVEEKKAKANKKGKK
jgi:hypothetical protein